MQESVLALGLQAGLLVALGLLLVTLATGLIRAAVGPSLQDRFSAVLLLGSSGVAVLLLLAILQKQPALFDVALVLALLAVVVTVAVTRIRGGRHD